VFALGLIASLFDFELGPVLQEADEYAEKKQRASYNQKNQRSY
jgi:hypothetical protein